MKREGDGATPVGVWSVRMAYYRADRMGRPRASVRVAPLRPSDGWCDAPKDRNYNRRVPYPYNASAERLWRADGRYDVVLVLGYNDRPRARGRGSAIFLHMAGAGRRPTEGCIALRRDDLLRLLRALPRGAAVRVP